ncbi:hypothetical protein SVAN01_03272 [Stagonosporopsis vannaccii]|nr:hypothetical protein SVAN01_03272 [Stagonosporopsis vannaccii]
MLLHVLSYRPTSKLTHHRRSTDGSTTGMGIVIINRHSTSHPASIDSSLCLLASQTNDNVFKSGLTAESALASVALSTSSRALHFITAATMYPSISSATPWLLSLVSLLLICSFAAHAPLFHPSLLRPILPLSTPACCPAFLLSLNTSMREKAHAPSMFLFLRSQPRLSAYARFALRLWHSTAWAVPEPVVNATKHLEYGHHSCRLRRRHELLVIARLCRISLAARSYGMNADAMKY